ncbi:MAG: glycerate kinase [Verrucomicrobia bacterium]|nr:glycerate kinase [Verrucomicrobiota bacterium]
MRLLLAFDKFKDALGAEEACGVAGEALGRRFPGAAVDGCPLTDGGEGFARILTRAVKGELCLQKVSGPLGRTVEGEFGLVPWSCLSPGVKKSLAIPTDREGVLGLVDMASASGLARLAPGERNPWKTSSLGTGELCVAAAKRGADLLLVGIGGSGTSDLGLGCLQALGLVALDPGRGEIRPLSPDQWEKVSRLDGELPLRFPGIRVACDVTNPLLGPRGAVRVYGPQKGLSASDLLPFEKAAELMARKLLAKKNKSVELMELPGAGAAGGIGFGLMVWAGAVMVSGANLVMEWLDLTARIRAADVVLSGEGRFDRSSLEGKGPSAVVRMALASGKRVHVFAGSVEPGLPIPAGLSIHEITPRGMALPEALGRTGELLARAVSAADFGLANNCLRPR